MRIVCKIHKPVKKDLLETIVFALKKIAERGKENGNRNQK